MIPYGRQDIRQEDIDAVIAVLKSDFLTQGPAVGAFETAVAGKVGAKFGIAANSATSALHIACLALDLGPGDLMWTSPVTFVASANAAVYCGADVDFVDIDPETFNMCPKALERKLEDASAAGRLPKIIMPVHMCGQSCDMAEIGALARRHGIRVIEDASHAIGGHYDGQPVGNCAHSDITVFSFHPVKIMTTAEGGLATTQQPELATRLERLRTHGITRDPAQMTHAPDGPWYYQQIELGWNYRMTDVQAALGLTQLERVDAYVARRNALAERYDTALADVAVMCPARDNIRVSAFHLYVIRLMDAAQHGSAFEQLRSRGIGVNLHYIPVYLQPYYRDLGFAPGHCPEAEAYYSQAISLPMFPSLTDEQQGDVAAALAQAVSR